MDLEAFEAGEALVELAVEGGFVAVEAGGFGGGVEEGQVGGLGVVLRFEGFQGFEVGFEAIDLGFDEGEEGGFRGLARGEVQGGAEGFGGGVGGEGDVEDFGDEGWDQACFGVAGQDDAGQVVEVAAFAEGGAAAAYEAGDSVQEEAWGLVAIVQGFAEGEPAFEQVAGAGGGVEEGGVGFFGVFLEDFEEGFEGFGFLVFAGGGEVSEAVVEGGGFVADAAVDAGGGDGGTL